MDTANTSLSASAGCVAGNVLIVDTQDTDQGQLKRLCQHALFKDCRWTVAKSLPDAQVEIKSNEYQAVILNCIDSDSASKLLALARNQSVACIECVPTGQPITPRHQLRGWCDSIPVDELNAGRLSCALRYAMVFGSDHQQLANEKRLSMQSYRQRTRFLSTVSHELRTPLNAIMGMAQLLRRDMDDVDEKQEACIESMYEASEHLLDIVNDILDFAQLESKKLKIEKAPVDIRQLIAEISTSMSVQAYRKNLRLVGRCNDDVPEWILADAKRLKQILMNLIGNAIKFTASGTITVAVSALAVDELDCQLRLSVVDTGNGIPEDKLQCIFRRFAQAEGDLSQQEGSGLGLAITKELASLMGGMVTVESHLGVGSTFSCELPFKISEPPEAPADLEVIASVPANFNGQVLLVEDDEINQRFANMLLHDLGCMVDIAASGREAIDKLEHGRYDLVFMDIGLPDYDGFELTKVIRRTIPKADDLPIIAMTAHAFARDKRRCIRAGMDDVVIKPVKEIAMRHVLQQYLEHSSDGVMAEAS